MVGDYGTTLWQRFSPKFFKEEMDDMLHILLASTGMCERACDNPLYDANN